MALRLRDHDANIIVWTAGIGGVGAGAWLAVDTAGWDPLVILFFGFLGFIFVTFPLGLALVAIYRFPAGIAELVHLLRYGRFLGR